MVDVDYHLGKSFRRVLRHVVPTSLEDAMRIAAGEQVAIGVPSSDPSRGVDGASATAGDKRLVA
jgi:hypothetical protein